MRGLGEQLPRDSTSPYNSSPGRFSLDSQPSTLDPSMWHGILGHDDVVERFRRTLARGRLASTYLFVGPAGIGKRRFALQLAQSLLCHASRRTTTARAVRPLRVVPAVRRRQSSGSGRRRRCRRINRRCRSSCSSATKSIATRRACATALRCKPFFGGRKVAIVDDADHFSHGERKLPAEDARRAAAAVAD